MQKHITAMGAAVISTKSLFVILLVIGQVSANGESPQGFQQVIADLSVADLRSFENDLLKARQTVITSLIKFISDKQNLRQSYYTASKCMDILGHYRATEAIETLLDDIAYPLGPVLARINLGNSFGVPSRYPAVDALAKIGHPTIPHLLTRLRRAQPVPGLFHKLTVKVIVALLGWDGAHSLLSKTLRDASADEKANLIIAVDELQALKIEPVGN
jgi:hypothetical protein